MKGVWGNEAILYILHMYIVSKQNRKQKKLLHILRKRSIQTLSITAILTFNELKNGVRLTLCQIRNEVKSSSIKMKVLNRLQFSFKIHRVKTKSKGFNVKWLEHQKKKYALFWKWSDYFSSNHPTVIFVVGTVLSKPIHKIRKTLKLAFLKSIWSQAWLISKEFSVLCNF